MRSPSSPAGLECHLNHTDTPTAPAPGPLSVERIHEYVWARYVNFQPAPFDLDEDAALAALEQHYRRQPIDTDSECFYFGILAYERSFGRGPQLRRRHLRSAIQAFEAYRQQTSDGFKFDPVDDRYTHVVEQLWPELEAAAGTALD